MIIDPTHLRRCSSYRISMGQNESIETSKRLIAHEIAMEIEAKLIEYDYFTIMEKSDHGQIVRCDLDVIVPPR